MPLIEIETELVIAVTHRRVGEINRPVLRDIEIVHKAQRPVLEAIGNDNDLREVMLGADGAYAGMAKGAWERIKAEEKAAKAAELAPYVEAAMQRKRWARPLAESEIPVVVSYGRTDTRGGIG